MFIMPSHMTGAGPYGDLLDAVPEQAFPQGAYTCDACGNPFNIPREMAIAHNKAVLEMSLTTRPMSPAVIRSFCNNCKMAELFRSTARSIKEQSSKAAEVAPAALALVHLSNAASKRKRQST